MILKDDYGHELIVPDNPRLQQAIHAGMVHLRIRFMEATILAPPNFDQLTDDEVLSVLRAAGEVGKILEKHDFKVNY